MKLFRKSYRRSVSTVAALAGSVMLVEPGTASAANVIELSPAVSTVTVGEVASWDITFPDEYPQIFAETLRSATPGLLCGDPFPLYRSCLANQVGEYVVVYEAFHYSGSDTGTAILKVVPPRQPGGLFGS